VSNHFIDAAHGIRQWVCWQALPRDGKLTKVPVDLNGYRVNVTKSVFFALGDCLRSSTQIGFVLRPNDPFICIDLDECNDWARHVHSLFPTYSEHSPSGRGCHIWLKGRKLARGIKRHGVEIYSQDRFITVTRNPIADLPIADCEMMLNALIDELGGPVLFTPAQMATGDEIPLKEDQELIAEIDRNPVRDKFWALWGYTPEARKHYRNDRSAMDQAFCNILRNFGATCSQIEAVWVRSPLGDRPDKVRSNSKRANDYRARTIARACDNDALRDLAKQARESYLGGVK
jgi:primase-polymerase (primpol)-like protein